MKTIKSLKNITTLEVGDVVVFENLVYKVRQNLVTKGYYLYQCKEYLPNDAIFDYLNLDKKYLLKVLVLILVLAWISQKPNLWKH